MGLIVNCSPTVRILPGMDQMKVQRDFELKDGDGNSMTVTVKGRQLVDMFSTLHEKSKNLCMLIVEGKGRADEDQDKFIFVDCLNASCEVKALN